MAGACDDEHEGGDDDDEEKQDDGKGVDDDNKNNSGITMELLASTCQADGTGAQDHPVTWQNLALCDDQCPCRDYPTDMATTWLL